jgi:hypothetical protein
MRIFISALGRDFVVARNAYATITDATRIAISIDTNANTQLTYILGQSEHMCY